MSTIAKNLDSNESIDELEFLKLQYQVLSERRINHNTLLWNVPSILFVALASLWTLALDSTKNLFVRLILSIFSIIITYSSFQLFERHRLMEVVDAEQMYSIEEYIRQKHHTTSNTPIMIVHHKLEKRTLIVGENRTVTDFINSHKYYKHKDKNSLCKMESYLLWKVIFTFSLIISYSITVCAAVELASKIVLFF